MSSHSVDDLMALADEFGVSAGPTSAQPEGKLLIHPSMRTDHLAAERLDEVLETWSYAAAGIYPPDLPIDLVPVLDHAVCENDDCDSVICLCHTGPCDDTVEQACSHHELLCDEHQLDCSQCLDDFRADRNDGRWI